MNDVFIGYLHAGQVAGNFCQSLARLVFHDANHNKRIHTVSSLHSGPRIAEARSNLVDRFIESGASWFLMVDSDMTFDATALDELLAVASRDERPIVGGLCFVADPTHGVKPTLYRLMPDGGSEVIYDYPRGEVVEVDYTGAAFLLVHRMVFSRVKEQYGKRADGSENPYPWFVECQVDRKGKALGEDVVFLLRARSCGLPVHVHCGVRTGHMKQAELTESMLLREV